MPHLLIRGDARALPLADRSVQCVVTSPPYYGLRDYGVAGQIGLETSPEAYVEAMVAVFREVRRVLRDDGTLWLNIGDSYANDAKGPRGDDKSTLGGSREYQTVAGPPGNGKAWRGGTLKKKDMIGIPWMLAFALRADGWYLRSEIVWHKPNVMPESVRDRPSKSHEQVFLLTKRPGYFYDAEAIKEARKSDSLYPGNIDPGKIQGTKGHQGGNSQFRDSGTRAWGNLTGKNSRSIWSISTNSLKEAHFATMPVKLALPCIKAGTPEKGCCPRCGAPWRRITTRVRKATRPGRDTKCLIHSDGDTATAESVGWNRPNVIGNRDPQRHVTETTTVGWESSCGHLEARTPVPCRVFDPFGGAMTTVLAAEILGRVGIATELKPEYLAMGKRRLERPRPLPTPDRPRPLPGQRELPFKDPHPDERTP